MNKCCENCKYYYPGNLDCRRYPPKIYQKYMNDIIIDETFPHIRDSIKTVCGEWHSGETEAARLQREAIESLRINKEAFDIRSMAGQAASESPFMKKYGSYDEIPEIKIGNNNENEQLSYFKTAVVLAIFIMLFLSFVF